MAKHKFRISKESVQYIRKWNQIANAEVLFADLINSRDMLYDEPQDEVAQYLVNKVGFTLEFAGSIVRALSGEEDLMFQCRVQPDIEKFARHDTEKYLIPNTVEIVRTKH